MANKSVIFVAALFSLLLTLSSATAAMPAKIFILAGQSNMAGRGGVDGGEWNRIVPPENKPNPSILRLDAHGKWRPARDPLHADIDFNKSCGVGPGMAFANAVRLIGRNPGRASPVIGLVPCAVGGTKIDQWGKGSLLYGEMVRRAREAVKGIDGGRITAVLWYQGESDTVDAGDADSYRWKMEKLIADLRDDLHDPSLLIIQVALASGEGKYIERVRKDQLGIKLTNVKTVDADGFGLSRDGLHLSSTAQARLGFKLALAFLGLDSSFSRLKNV
ncbi:hypothetical protein V2J09_007494 [Rumex salicifolius]